MKLFVFWSINYSVKLKISFISTDFYVPYLLPQAKKLYFLPPVDIRPDFGNILLLLYMFPRQAPRFLRHRAPPIKKIRSAMGTDLIIFTTTCALMTFCLETPWWWLSFKTFSEEIGWSEMYKLLQLKYSRSNPPVSITPRHQQGFRAVYREFLWKFLPTQFQKRIDRFGSPYSFELMKNCVYINACCAKQAAMRLLLSSHFFCTFVSSVKDLLRVLEGKRGIEGKLRTCVRVVCNFQILEYVTTRTTMWFNVTGNALKIISCTWSITFSSFSFFMSLVVSLDRFSIIFERFYGSDKA